MEFSTAFVLISSNEAYPEILSRGVAFNVRESLTSSFDERRSSTQELTGRKPRKTRRCRKIDNKRPFL
jgi:hypothetical protein